MVSSEIFITYMLASSISIIVLCIILINTIRKQILLSKLVTTDHKLLITISNLFMKLLENDEIIAECSSIMSSEILKIKNEK